MTEANRDTVLSVGSVIPCALGILVVSSASAMADPEVSASVRVSGSYGVLEQKTWAYPEIELVGTLAFHERGYVSLAAGIGSLDNHTYLADGHIQRIEVGGGVTLSRLRVGGTFSIDDFSFNSDPDVLTEHPGVDLVVRRYGLMPGVGAQVSYAFGKSTTVGAFTRVWLQELTLFETSSGDRERARLVLFGAFVELKIR